MQDRRLAGVIALGAFLAYLALLPGSTATVALDMVPQWGAWMGGALLVLQGIAAAAWLVGLYGRRGAAAALALLLIAWAVEHVGATTGLLFGRYAYTAALEPQLLGVVPLPITCAWLMVALGAWQLGGGGEGRARGLLATATLVVAIDLQIETVATQVNRYWVWADGGPYFGVPLHNFAGWWAVGLAMALALRWLLPAPPAPRPGRWAAVWLRIPALLYLLSVAMFTVVNVARGYGLAALAGLALLALGAWPQISARRGGGGPGAGRTSG